MSNVQVITLGCRLNAAESDAITQALSQTTPPTQQTIVINTCAVTAQAVREARQLIRRHKRDNPQARLVVTGCASETEYATFAAMPEVDALVPNTRKTDANAYALNAELAHTQRVPTMSLPATPPQSARVRAYVPVQNGCNHRCTFCIIPYGRGPSRSVPIAEVVQYVQQLCDQGTSEVVLTGVDLTAWGQDLPNTPPLGRLVRQILRQVPALKWLRLSSIDAAEADAELQEVLAYETRFVPYLHVSLQSGNNMILKRMKRRHSREQALELIEQLRAHRPDLALGADFIAGFPTEDEAMFADTLSLIDAARIAYVHAFAFSPRVGTPAARMPQLPPAVIKERAQQLRTHAQASLQRHLQQRVGTSAAVLAETSDTGRCADFTPVRFNVPVVRGQFYQTQITHWQDDKAFGTVLTPPNA